MLLIYLYLEDKFKYKVPYTPLSIYMCNINVQ